MKISNPEIQRFAWLECSKHRLVAIPAVFALIIIISAQYEHATEIIHAISLGALGLLLLLWGGNKASESITDELNDATWDFQRLSSLSPWDIALGKILGAPLICWYGSVFALIAYVATSPISFINTLFGVCFIVGGALLCHATAIAINLQAISARPTRARMRAFGGHLIGLIAGWSFFMSAYQLEEYASSQPRFVEWYDALFDETRFMLTILAMFLAWAFGAVVWQLRGQLRMRTGPWFLAAFLLFMIILYCGFNTFESQPTAQMRVAVGFTMALGTTYILALIEPLSGVHYKKWMYHFQRSNMKEFWHLFPRWIATLFITLPILAWLMVSFRETPQAVWLLIACMGFALRDIAIVHYFKLHPQQKRVLGTAVFYIFILYTLLPILFKALNLDVLSHLFLPDIFNPTQNHDSMYLSAISSLIQASVTIFMCFKRWQTFWAVPAESSVAQS